MQSDFSWAPKVARKCESKYWYACGADGWAAGGRAVYGHVITKFSGMGRFTYPWCSAGALRAPELRYKKPICKNDKNESLTQPIKSLSSSSYQLIEDYVLTAFAADRLPGVKDSDVIVCTKSSRIALEYVRFKLRTKSTSGYRQRTPEFSNTIKVTKLKEFCTALGN